MIKIFYPRGSGGSWLSNLIWHLEQNNFILPTVDVVFDGQTGSKSVKFQHAFEIYDSYKPDKVTYREWRPKDKLFSCKYLFNHYLNNAVKVKFHIEGLGEQSFQNQLFALSDGARYYLTNEHYQRYYCKNIDLDYSLIFMDPEQFIDKLFLLLDGLGIRYTPNRDYALKSIEYYRSTCPDPADHFDNFESLLWLGCCHAVTIIDQLQIDGIIGPDADSKSAKELLVPYADHCRNRIKDQMFEWKK